LRRNLKGDDITIILQWGVSAILTPFILIPSVENGPASAHARIAVISLLYGTSLIMTLLYLFIRKRSERGAGRVVAYMAFIDVAIVLLALLMWRAYIPDLFWVLILMVVVVATRFGYAVALPVTLIVCALYTAVMVIGEENAVSLSKVTSDALLRTMFMAFIAAAIVYFRSRELRELESIRVFSECASKMGATLDFGEVLRFACEGIARILKGANVLAYKVDRRTAKAKMAECYPVEQGMDICSDDLEVDSLDERLSLGVLRDGEGVVSSRELKGLESSQAQRMLTQRRQDGEFMVFPADVNSELSVLFIARFPKQLANFEREAVEVCRSIVWLTSAALEKCLKYSEEKQRRAESDSLYRTLRKLGSSLTVSDVALSACKMVIDGTGVRGSSLFVLDEKNRCFTPTIAVESSGFAWEEFSVGNEIPSDEIERSFGVFEQDVLVIEEPEKAEFLPPFLKAEGIVAMAPFYAEGRISGVICASDEKGKYFTDNEISRLRTVASEAGLAISNAQLHDKIAADAAQLSSLMNLTNAIGSTNNLSTIMTLALDTARHLFDCKYGLIYRIDETEGTLRYVDSFGYPEYLLEKIALPPYLPVNECVVAYGERIHTVQDLSTATNVCQVLKEVKSGSSVCVALRAEKKTLGLLHLQSTEPWAFRDEDLQFITAIADQVAIALQRASLFEEVNRLAITDPLTGVFNVRRLETSLKDEFSRAKRYQRPLSFLMIDVDRLKLWNDTFGHPHGDMILCNIASILDKNTRDVDKVFRYGGDEFCVLLPETDLTEGVVVAEKLRRAVGEFMFPGKEKLQDTPITISVGVSSVSEVKGAPDELVRSADEALYEAKRMGGNRVATYRGSTVV